MANVMFKRGAQSDLAKYLSTGSSQAIDGAFYLTSDTNRLYVGKDLGSGNIKAVPVNQGVITVESCSFCSQRISAVVLLIAMLSTGILSEGIVSCLRIPSHSVQYLTLSPSLVVVGSVTTSHSPST